jgi:hypothetical protein
VKTYYCTAEVLLRLWEAALADHGPSAASLAEPARAACRVLADYAGVFAIGQPGRLLWRGLYRWLIGRRRAALGDWRRAAAAAERLGMEYEEAAASAELGRHLTGSARRECLGKAVTIFERIGARHAAAEAAAALAS